MQNQFRVNIKNSFLCLIAPVIGFSLLWLNFAAFHSINSVQAQALFENEILTQQRSLTQAYVTNDVEMADVDADGDLDMLLVNEVRPYLLVYMNNGGNYDEVMAWDPQDLVGRPTNAAWGDADGDGDLDLAVAVWGGNRPHFVYRNEGGRLLDKPDFITIIPHQRNLNWDAHAVAWGDLNGDGKLDLVFGHGRIDPEAEATAQIPRLTQANVIYQNTTSEENPTLTFTAVWTSTSQFPTKEIALADVDGDNDLDIAVANGDLSSPPKQFTNTLYINNMTTTNGFDFTEIAIVADDSPKSDSGSTSVAWANLVVEDGDTQLPELVIGNLNAPSEIYCNTALPLAPPQLERCWDSTVMSEFVTDGDFRATHVAAADINFDGHLDLAISGFNRPNYVLCGDGTSGLSFEICWNSNQFGLNLLTQRLLFADVNGDSRLDLIEGNGGGATVEQPLHIYDNLQSTLLWQTLTEGKEAQFISSSSVGDLDHDGDLDLVVGRTAITTGVTDSLYLNVNGALIQEIPLSLQGAEDALDSRTQSVALADYDGDGRLDLAIGRGTRQTSIAQQPMANAIYRNVSSEADANVNFELVWSSMESISVTTSVTWGDLNGDGFLDLAVGNVGDTLDSNGIFLGEFNQVFVYDPDTSSFGEEAAWQSPEPRQTYDLAWGDVDNDGDLDLVVANFNQPNELFINEGGQLAEQSAWVPNGRYYSTDIELADINGDGLLDLVVSNGIPNTLQKSFLYLNQNGTFPVDPDWSTEAMPAGNVAVADVDNDGDDDVAFGTYSIIGNRTYNHLYLNDGGLLRDTPVEWQLTLNRGVEGLGLGDLLWGDIDSDGDTELIDLFRRPVPIDQRVITNTLFMNGQLPLRTSIRIKQTGAVNYFDAEAGTVTLPFELTNVPNGDRLTITAFYSLNGGGLWQPLIGQWREEAAVQPITSPLQAGVPYLYTFNPVTNGLLGRSENFVVRLVATPYQTEGSRLLYENVAPEPVLFGSPATVSPPFRVAGRQIQVVDLSGSPLSGAIVLNQTDESELFRPYANLFDAAKETLDFQNSESVYQTDAVGYLQGRGALSNNNRLVALLPVALNDTGVPQNIVSLLATEAETSVLDLYHVSHSPTATGIQSAIVDDSPLQTLTIDPSNKLYLFNLDVSLEWDASNEPGYLAQLQQDIERASAILYDLTDGQMALGQINIFMNKERWRESHIQIHASNRYRPNADFGGIVSRPMSLTLGVPESSTPLTNTIVLSNTAGSALYGTGTITNAIWPGQVRMPALWNRFGEPGFEGGEDWARTLAHELGHYLLFLPDNYLLAREETNYLLEVDNNNPCTPSAMTTAYANTSEHNSEFLPTLDSPLCEDVIAATLTGLGDWEIISTIYGIQPQPFTEGGPSRLPLAVTQVTLNFPEVDALAPIDSFFFVDFGDGTTEALSPRTVSSYLIRSGGLVTDVIPLGAPIGNQIWARGAKVGDELCVYDAPVSSEAQQSRSACGVISVNGVSLRFEEMSWVPIVTVEPPEIGTDVPLERPFPTTLSLTIGISQTNALDTLSIDDVSIQLFTNLISQTIAYPAGEIALTQTENQNVFTTVVDVEDIPVDGYIRIWINNQKEAQVMVPFFLGGGWLPDHWASGPDHWASGPDHWASGPDHWASGVGFRSGWNAPVSTGNGELMIFNMCSAFDTTPAYELQAVPAVPNLPLWLVPVGNAYQITLDDNHVFANCPIDPEQEVTTSLLFNYLERDLPNRVYEDHLQVYYLDNNEWKPIENTTQNTLQNLVSGGYLTNTLYVLGMSTEMTLTRGWNLIGYPLRQPQLISDLIAPIEEDIALIYGYSNGVLQAFCPEESARSGGQSGQGQRDSIRLICSRQGNNTLTQFEFGQGYYILATNETTLRLPVDLIDGEALSDANEPETTALPAIIYGTVEFPKDSVGGGGAKLIAWMDGQPCGEAEVEEIEGQFTYQLAILQQTSANELPCGELNQPISITLNGTNLKQTAYWDNRVVHELPLVSPEALKTNKAGNFAWILVTSIGVILGGSGLLLYRRRGKKPLS